MDITNEVERRIAAKIDEFGKVWSSGAFSGVAATRTPHPFFTINKDKRKPLSPRRARELRDRRLKRLFGSRRQRAERFARLVASYGLDRAKYFDRYGMRPDA